MMTRHALSIFLILIASANHTDEIKTGFYQVETRLLLPHLEEMRRTISTETICIKDNQVEALFPILKQPGMNDCLFVQTQSTGIETIYSLQCPGKNAAKGTAVLKKNENGISAELNAKMGGKNMTFSQFSNAELLGQCSN